MKPYPTMSRRGIGVHRLHLAEIPVVTDDIIDSGFFMNFPFHLVTGKKNFDYFLFPEISPGARTLEFGC